MNAKARGRQGVARGRAPQVRERYTEACDALGAMRVDASEKRMRRALVGDPDRRRGLGDSFFVGADGSRSISGDGSDSFFVGADGSRSISRDGSDSFSVGADGSRSISGDGSDSFSVGADGSRSISGDALRVRRQRVDMRVQRRAPVPAAAFAPMPVQRRLGRRTPAAADISAELDPFRGSAVWGGSEGSIPCFERRPAPWLRPRSP